MEFITIILFALALNLDSFAAGFAYGTRKIQVPPLSLLIINLISMAAISASMLAGKIIVPYLPPAAAHRIGGFILLCIGVWVLIQNSRTSHFNRGQHEQPEGNESKIVEISIRPLGLVVQIMSHPARADLDRSGTITPGEALLLGVALAMDALGAGFAVSMLGFPIGSVALTVGIGHFCLTYAGLTAGRLFASCRIGRRLTTLPGCLLILLGLFKIH